MPLKTLNNDIAAKIASVLATTPFNLSIAPSLISLACFEASFKAIAATNKPPEIISLATAPIAPNTANPDNRPSITSTVARVPEKSVIASLSISFTRSLVSFNAIADTSKPPLMIALATLPTAPNTAKPAIKPRITSTWANIPLNSVILSILISSTDLLASARHFAATNKPPPMMPLAIPPIAPNTANPLIAAIIALTTASIPSKATILPRSIEPTDADTSCRARAATNRPPLMIAVAIPPMAA